LPSGVTVLAPEKRENETLTADGGDTLILLKASYADGTIVRHPIAVRLSGLPYPIEIVLLDPLVPSPQTIRLLELLPAEPTERGRLRVKASPRRELAELARVLDFGPSVPFKARIRQAQGFTSAEVVLSPRASWEAFAPLCSKDEWLGFARLREGNDAQTALARMNLTTLKSPSPFAGSPSQPYFLAAAFVCLSLEQTAGPLAPAKP